MLGHSLPAAYYGPQYVVWQKSNETEFLLTMNFILFTYQGYPLQNSSLGQLQSDGGVLEGFCWYTFQLVGYGLLDIIQSTKMAPFLNWFLNRGNKKKLGTEIRRIGGLGNHRNAFFLPKIH